MIDFERQSSFSTNREYRTSSIDFVTEASKSKYKWHWYWILAHVLGHRRQGFFLTGHQNHSSDLKFYD